MKNNLIIIGNSVCFRICPETDTSKNYGELTYDRKHFQNLINYGKTALLVKKTNRNLQNLNITYSDTVIVNFGIVDACTRAVNKPLYDFMMNKKGNIKDVFRIIISSIESRLRPYLVSLRGNRSWSSIKEFEIEYLAVIKQLKVKKCRIILLGINEPNARIEKNLPGSQNKVQLFNKVIKKMAKKEQLPLIETKNFESTLHYPDGIHYNQLGHKKMAKLILHAISNSD